MTTNTPHTTIRVAREADAPELLAIYAPYVERSVITFEYDVPTDDEFARRIRTTLDRYPYLVAEGPDGRILGYAYASSFKARAAYDWAVELSVYLATDQRGQGIGRVLYAALEDLLAQQHVTNLNACITYADTEDALHDNRSVRFHQRLGFELVAHFHQCGYKFDRWWDMVWMEKVIAPHDVPHPAFVPFGELR